jgi:hypothetical protein
MGALVAVVKPLLMQIATSPAVKKLVLDLLEKYVRTTDNSIDDMLLTAVRGAMFKDQVTGQVSDAAAKLGIKL